MNTSNIVQELMKKLGVNIDLNLILTLVRVNDSAAKEYLRRALIVPGLRRVDLEQVATRNKDQAIEIIAKRDKMIDAVIEFLLEYTNLDSD